MRVSKSTRAVTRPSASLRWAWCVLFSVATSYRSEEAFSAVQLAELRSALAAYCELRARSVLASFSLLSCVACVEHVERKPPGVTARPRAGQKQNAAPNVIQRTCVSDAAGNETCRETIP